MIYLNAFPFSTKIKYVPNRVTLKKFAHLSFYKRSEPKLGINFLSNRSKTMLKDTIEQKTSGPFFPLIDQFITQNDPSYCGISNMVILLNALKVDPGRKWKGIWRWYYEENIKCCDTEKIKDYGMTIGDFASILICNNVKSKIYRPVSQKYPLSLITPDLNKINYKKQEKELFDDLTENEYTCIKHEKGCHNKDHKKVVFNIASTDLFRTLVYASTKFNSFFLLCTLGRGALGQTGDGHFTPIAAYHKDSDYGLLLESARFKYNSRWYKTEDIYKSLIKNDSITERSRGFLLIDRQIGKMKKNFVFIPEDVDLSSLRKTIRNSLYPKTIQRKAEVLNWLFENDIKVRHISESRIMEKIWREIVLGYNTDKSFKDYVNLIYSYDRVHFIENIIATIIKFKL